MSFSPHFVKGLVKKIFPTLLKTQQINFAFGIFGQIKAQSGLMSEIVREVPGAKKHKHRLKRFWRFLSNPRVNPDHLRLFWVKWVIKTFCHDRIVRIAIDWTALPGNIQCLMIAIPFKGRAIPLLWHIVFHCDIKDSQNLIEQRLLTRLINLVKQVSADKKLLVTADRGFGRATLIQFLLQKKILFVLRVKGDVTITTQKGKKRSLRTIGKRLQNNTPVWYQSITYRADELVSGVHLAAVVTLSEKKEPDPWFLITNVRKSRNSNQRVCRKVSH